MYVEAPRLAQRNAAALMPSANAPKGYGLAQDGADRITPSHQSASSRRGMRR